MTGVYESILIYHLMMMKGKLIDEAEKFLRNEVFSRDKLAKQCKRRAAAFMFSNIYYRSSFMF